MNTPQITIHDCATGETVTRDLNETELTQFEADQAQTKNETTAKVKSDTAKAAARQAVLDKLGLTADEVAALLG